MRIANHRMMFAGGEGDSRISPNHSGALSRPLGIIVHFTAGRGFEETTEWFCNPASKSSAHLLIGRDGRIRQLVSFNKQAWHAGQSKWTFDATGTQVEHLNAYTIGIELDNYGHLQRRAKGWSTYFGRVVPPDDVVIALDGTGWHAYTEEQVEATVTACRALVAAYPSIGELLGHSDVAPLRKLDPGPAFPMIATRSRVFGRISGEQ